MSARLTPRTLLFVPADRAPELLDKAERSSADGVIVDLEDAVPAVSKEIARRDGIAAIEEFGGGIPVYVRVNGVHTDWFAGDIAALAGIDIAGVMLPKSERPSDVRRVAAALDASAPSVIALIETPKGILASPHIASEPDVVGVAFGAVDFATEMGIQRTRHGRELLFARSQLTLAARAAGVWALDSPCTELVGDQCRREAVIARALGFDGKLVIHPDQVNQVHDAFAPSAAELAQARAVVEAFAAIERSGSGVGTLDGELVERPVADAAQGLLDRAISFEKES
jgi:citrate lyase subunit beta / citryl-CoA lyase